MLILVDIFIALVLLSFALKLLSVRCQGKVFFVLIFYQLI